MKFSSGAPVPEAPFSFGASLLLGALAALMVRWQPQDSGSVQSPVCCLFVMIQGLRLPVPALMRCGFPGNSIAWQSALQTQSIGIDGLANPDVGGQKIPHAPGRFT